MSDAVLFKKWCDRFESFPGVLAAFICTEVNKGFTRLILDKGEPRTENCKNSCGGFAWDNVDPNISGGFIDEGDEVETVTEGFWRDRTNVGEYSEKFSCRPRVWILRKRFGCLFSHYTNMAFTKVIRESHESHAFGRGVGETLMHELRRHVRWNIGNGGNWRRIRI